MYNIILCYACIILYCAAPVLHEIVLRLYYIILYYACFIVYCTTPALYYIILYYDGPMRRFGPVWANTFSGNVFFWFHL